jgi:hypothetical protein
MGNRIVSLLVWVAIALLLVVPYELYPPISAHVGATLFYGACLIIFLLALSGLKSGKTPRRVVQSLSVINYLYCSALIAGAYAWGWLTVHVFGLGMHFFSAVVVAVPALILLATAANIAFRGLYIDVGLSAPDSRIAKKTKKKKKKQTGESAA